jgi:hypothetical protein
MHAIKLTFIADAVARELLPGRIDQDYIGGYSWYLTTWYVLVENTISCDEGSTSLNFINQGKFEISLDKYGKTKN